MVTIKVSDEKFRELVGEPTGETGPDGLAIHRVAKERLRDSLAGADLAVKATGSTSGGGSPGATSVASDAMLRELFGDSIFAESQEARRALAREILEEGPVLEAMRSQRLILAGQIGSEADIRRQAGAPDSGLEVLAAAGFLSADANALAIQYSRQACEPECLGFRRALAATVEAIASSRSGAGSVEVNASMLNRLADRIGAPGLKRFEWRP